MNDEQVNDLLAGAQKLIVKKLRAMQCPEHMIKEIEMSQIDIYAVAAFHA